MSNDLAFILVSINVSIHATSMAELFRRLTREQAKIEEERRSAASAVEVGTDRSSGSRPARISGLP